MEYQQFINFLKAKKIYKTYMNYFHDFFVYGRKEDIWLRTKEDIHSPEKLFKFKNGDLMFTEAFSWRRTDEGYDFWEEIDDMWKTNFN